VLLSMDTKGRLVAGSHNRNEFVLINADETARVRECVWPLLLCSFIAFKISHFLCFCLCSITHVSKPLEEFEK